MYIGGINNDAVIITAATVLAEGHTHRGHARFRSSAQGVHVQPARRSQTDADHNYRTHYRTAQTTERFAYAYFSAAF